MRIDSGSDRQMAATFRRRIPRPWLPLISELIRLAGDHAEFERHSERAWSSVTFSGARHSIVLSFTGEEAIEAGEDFIAALPDHEFTVPGQLVADATITSAQHVALPVPRLTVEAELLLLDDC